LVDINGKLVGINTAIISGSGGYSGNSFAIPVTIVKKVVEDIIEFGTVQRAILGVSLTDVNADIAKKNDLSVIKRHICKWSKGKWCSQRSRNQGRRCDCKDQ